MDIMENILRVANPGAKKTRIMYRCNLSFKQLNVYLRRFLKNISVVEYLGTRNNVQGNLIGPVSEEAVAVL
jgi:predicted transcriptional regulator